MLGRLATKREAELERAMRKPERQIFHSSVARSSACLRSNLVQQVLPPYLHDQAVLGASAEPETSQVEIPVKGCCTRYAAGLATESITSPSAPLMQKQARMRGDGTDRIVAAPVLVLHRTSTKEFRVEVLEPRNETGEMPVCP